MIVAQAWRGKRYAVLGLARSGLATVDALLAGLRPLLDASSGVMFVTDTYVSRPDYFS